MNVKVVGPSDLKARYHDVMKLRAHIREMQIELQMKEHDLVYEIVQHGSPATLKINWQALAYEMKD